jgi:hypothetical protein
MDAKISNDVLDAYVRCSYKAYLLLDGKREELPSYAALRELRRNTLRDQVATKLRAELGDDVGEGVTVTPAALAKAAAVLLTPTLTRERFDLRLDGLKRVPGESSLGAFHYVPILITADSRVRNADRLLIEMLALLLAP